MYYILLLLELLVTETIPHQQCSVVSGLQSHSWRLSRVNLILHN